MERNATGERLVRRASYVFEWVENGVYVALAALLTLTALMALVGAITLLFRGLDDWTGTESIFAVIERLLFVLMLVEIMHTVRASVQAHALVAEPFLVVALIATIRRILIVTLESTKSGPVSLAAMRASLAELIVLGGLALVMVISIVLLRRNQHG